MARPPKPTSLKDIVGTIRPDRVRENEPIPPQGEIVMPAFLKKRALELWEQYAPKVIATGTMTVLDVHLLAEWCQLTVKMERSRTTASERAQRRMIGGELGIGAASRAKIGAGGKRGKVDPADEFFDPPQANEPKAG
jgi:hypothetical protein